MGIFRFLTAGESHGPGLMVIVEGVQAGLPLSEEDIARDLARRQVGYGRGERMHVERDRAEIWSGVRYGRTTGSPIGLLIRNKDWENWQATMSVAPVEQPVDPVTRLRPGHADLPGVMKYGLDDVRPILERASARETAARTTAGAVARRFLAEFGVEVHSHTLAIGGVWAQHGQTPDWDRVEASLLRCADPVAEQAMIAAIDQARVEGDSLGGVFEVVTSGVPIGLGSHVHWDRRLDGRIAQAIMSINAVKGVEIGAGFAGAGLKGSHFHDVIEPISQGGRPWPRRSNNAGGLEGGMTNGEALVVRAALKPIPTLARPLPSADLKTGEMSSAHVERSDVCVVPAAGVVGEAMLALVLAEAWLEKFGGDHLVETRRNYEAYLETMGPRGE